MLHQFISIFLHLDKYLSVVIQDYGIWTYLILFLVIFCETGLVVTPFLPGDSLLFAAGTFAALGAFDVNYLSILIIVAALAGNTVNYSIGYMLGPKVLNQENARILRKEYLEKTHRFYEKYGGMTLIISRFAPIIRTFAPFLAGVGRMGFIKFSAYNLIGGVSWVLSFVYGGYFFGNIPIVRQNFTLVIMIIVFLSLLPSVFEIIRHRRKAA